MKSLFAAVLLVVSLSTTANAEYLAGVAEQNITPCPPSFPHPCGERIAVLQEISTTGGAAQQVVGVDTDFDNTPSELLVRALVIEDAGGNRIALVGVDLLGFDREFVRSVKLAITKATSIAPDHVLLNASHTHNGPAVKYLIGAKCAVSSNEQLPLPEYVNAVKGRIVIAVQAAVNALQSASLYFGHGTTSIAGYRRNDGERTYRQASSEGLDILEARDAAAHTIAKVMFVRCHPATQYGTSTISADYVSEARKGVEQSGGGKVVFIQGFGGDLNPWRLMQGVSDRKALTGAALASDVNNVTVAPLTGPLSVVEKTGTLALNANPSSWNLTYGGAAQPPWSHYGPAGLDFDVQVLRIGSDPDAESSWTLLAISNEVVSEFVQTVANAFPEIRHLTLAGYSNGVESYLPTARMIAYDRQHCSALPDGYEGCYSFALYYRAPPAWTDSDFLNVVRSAVRASDSSLYETFADTSRDVYKWNVHVLGQIGCTYPFDAAVSVSQGGGQLQIVPLDSMSGYHYNGYVSEHTYDFTGKSAAVSVDEAPTGSAAEFLLSVGPDGSHLYRFDIQGTASGVQIYCHFHSPDGTPNHVPCGAYNPATQRYVRVRHDGTDDHIYWEWSTDNSTWTSLHNEPRQFDITSSRIELMAGSWTASASPGRARVADFSLK
jgi:hypothetical protein